MSEPSFTPKVFGIALSKVSSYLLDIDHPIGRTKARLLMRFGFDPADPNRLCDALLSHAQTARFVGEDLTPLGETKLIYEGPLKTPDGRLLMMRTVWRIRLDEAAEFVSAVPIKR